MARQIVTANRLTDGRVVYFAAGGTWSEWPREAAVAGDDTEAAALLARAQADAVAGVVEPYLIELDDNDAEVTPRRYRELIRASGPSVRRDLGKQAAPRPGQGGH